MINTNNRFQLTKLSNQLQVLTLPMKERESAAVAIWVRAGGRHEPERLSGVSHFLEHMLFKGTANRSHRQIKKEVEGVGGMLNAFTAEEATCYFSKLPVEYFTRALDVLVDMVREASLTAKEIERERHVILEEIKMYRDQPSQYVHELMSELLWPDQPLGRSLAGTSETVSAIRRSDIVGYKKRYYRPTNILVSVAGRVSPAEIAGLTKKYFASENGGTFSRFEKARVHQTQPRFRFVEKETEQTHLVVGFHGFSKKDPRRYALGLLNIVLGGNMSSRLFEEVREKRGLAYEIKSGTGFYQDTGLISVSAGVENRKIVLAVQVILQELKRLVHKPVSREELRRAKDYFMGQFLMGLEDNLDHLLWLGEKILYLEKIPEREAIRREVEKFTAADLQKVAKQVFQEAHLNLTLIGPVKGKEQEKIRRAASIL